LYEKRYKIYFYATQKEEEAPSAWNGFGRYEFMNEAAVCPVDCSGKKAKKSDKRKTMTAKILNQESPS
jgi:hypothetical protein